MLTPADCHQRLLQALLDPPIARVHLVARLVDDSIAALNPSTLYVFIPDLHLVSDAMAPHYAYHTNEMDLFYAMLWRVQEARTALAQEGNLLDVIQLGDLYDLWREQTLVPDSIINDYTNALGMLYRHAAGLGARILVGNHDVDMLGADQYSTRIFLPSEAAGAFCLTLHGDWFDPLEQLPEWLKRFVLCVAGPAPQPREYPVGELKDILQREAQASNNFRTHIRLAAPAALDALQHVAHPALPLPDEWNVRRTSRPEPVHPFLAQAQEVVHHCQNTAGTAPTWPTVRLIVIGHSHHARVAVDDTTDPMHPVILMDCGAWIERYQDSQGQEGPNCQIGVVAGGDLRIYQLDPQA